MARVLSKWSLPILLILPTLLFAQNAEEQIAEIRLQYASVESRLSSCTIIRETEWVDEDDYEGGIPIIEGFYDSEAGNYIKITQAVEGDWMELITSYYLKDGSVFFVFIKAYYPGDMFTAEELGMTEEMLWESGGEAKTLFAQESRIYIWDDKAIRHLEKQLEIDASLNGFDMSHVDNVVQSEDAFSAKYMRKHMAKAIVELEKRRTASK